MFEAQNSVFRFLVKNRSKIKTPVEMVFLGNSYSGYWFPHFLLGSKGTIWGVGLGHDSSFEYELVSRGYDFFGFEPESNCFESSTRQFQNTNATLANYGLWDKSGHFHYSGRNVSIVNIFQLEKLSRDTLEIRSLWEVAEEKKIDDSEYPRILKLNIEGAEREILKKFIVEPLEFEVIIFQAEFLFHVGFKRIFKKIRAYRELSEVLSGFHQMQWEIVHLTRHQITLIKKELIAQEHLY
jgi:FkbM family methyltransferase